MPVRDESSVTVRREPVESLSLVSRSPQQTRTWGKKLGKWLRGGEIIGLTGELGSGKTCFVRGISEGLKVDPNASIRSPTFTLINEYGGPIPLYHIDLYRIERAGELEELNLRDYLFSDGVTVVEWFERFPEGEIEDKLVVHFEHRSPRERKIVFDPQGKAYVEMVRELMKGKRS